MVISNRYNNADCRCHTLVCTRTEENGKRKTENGKGKTASKREQNQARLNYAKREQIQDDKVDLKRKTENGE